MATISFRVNSRDEMLIRKYAELNNMDVSSFVRQAVMEKMENNYDLASFDKVWDEEKDQEKKSQEELKRELGL